MGRWAPTEVSASPPTRSMTQVAHRRPSCFAIDTSEAIRRHDKSRSKGHHNSLLSKKLEHCRTLQLRVTLQTCCSSVVQRNISTEILCWMDALMQLSSNYIELYRTISNLCDARIKKIFPPVVDHNGKFSHRWSSQMIFPAMLDATHSETGTQPSSPPDQRPECQVSGATNEKIKIKASTTGRMTDGCSMPFKRHLDVLVFLVV